MIFLEIFQKHIRFKLWSLFSRWLQVFLCVCVFIHTYRIILMYNLSLLPQSKTRFSLAFWVRPGHQLHPPLADSGITTWWQGMLSRIPPSVKLAKITANLQSKLNFSEKTNQWRNHISTSKGELPKSPAAKTAPLHRARNQQGPLLHQGHGCSKCPSWTHVTFSWLDITFMIPDPNLQPRRHPHLSFSLAKIPNFWLKKNRIAMWKDLERRQVKCSSNIDVFFVEKMSNDLNAMEGSVLVPLVMRLKATKLTKLLNDGNLNIIPVHMNRLSYLAPSSLCAWHWHHWRPYLSRCIPGHPLLSQVLYHKWHLFLKPVYRLSSERLWTLNCLEPVHNRMS